VAANFHTTVRCVTSATSSTLTTTITSTPMTTPIGRYPPVISLISSYTPPPLKHTTSLPHSELISCKMGSFQTSRHTPSYGHRLWPHPRLVSQDRCSSVLPTTYQPLQSFHRYLYCPGSVEGCLHSLSFQSRFSPLSRRFPTHYAGFIKNPGKNSCKTFPLLPHHPH